MIELGFDYTCFLQPTIDANLAKGLYNAGMRRCALGMDAADNTFQTAQILVDNGINLDGYRELSGPATYVQQEQSALDGYERLAKANIYCRLNWLTAEDTGSGITRDVAGRRLVGLRSTHDIVLPSAASVSSAGIEQRVAAFHAALEVAKGLRNGVYTGEWYWPTWMGNTTDFKGLPLWHAGYDSNAVLEAVNYGGWTQPFAHQYASPVSVAGSVGLDLDAWGVDQPNPAPGPLPTPTPDALTIASAAITIRLSTGQVLTFSGVAQ